MKTTRTITHERSLEIYEKLLAFYPSGYLSKHRDELLQNFEDLERDIGSSKMFWAFIIEDFIKSLTYQYMEYIKHSKKVQILLGAIVIIVLFMGYQFFMLRNAHSTFANYATFRGCQQITNQTATSGTCVIGSGKSITIVKINDKWYLEGDGPGIF